MKWAFALLLCTASIAAAQPAKTKAAATAAYNEGQKRYAAGDYRAAAEKFIAAYTADPDPAYLFNIAQAYRFAHECGEAARYYRQFLAAVENPPNADRIRRYIDEMDGCAHGEPGPAPAAATAVPTRTDATRTGADATTTGPTSATGPASAASWPTSATAPTSPAAAPATDHADTGATRRHIGLAVGVVGIAAIAAGVYFQHRVGIFEDKTNACTQAEPCTAEQVHDWDRTANTASTRAILGYSVGGAALVTGVTLYLLGRHTEHPVAIAPTRAGAVVTAAFAF